MTQKELDKKIEKLKLSVKEGDNELIHSLYDQIIEVMAGSYDIKLLKKLNKIVDGVQFWYA